MFSRFAASGLAILFGVQAAINMSVNLQLIPAKGMTLPFISYGGSSLIMLMFAAGLLLSISATAENGARKKQPRASRAHALPPAGATPEPA